MLFKNSILTLRLSRKKQKKSAFLVVRPLIERNYFIQFYPHSSTQQIIFLYNQLTSILELFLIFLLQLVKKSQHFLIREYNLIKLHNHVHIKQDPKMELTRSCTFTLTLIFSYILHHSNACMQPCCLIKSVQFLSFKNHTQLNKVDVNI